MKKYSVIVLLLLLILFIPSFANAAWWNPLTWNWNPFIWFNTNTAQPIISAPESLSPPNITQPVQPKQIPLFNPVPPPTPPQKQKQSAPDKSVPTPPPPVPTPPSIPLASPSPAPSSTVLTPPAAPVSPPSTIQSAPPPNTTFCNGTYWNRCPAGLDFVCPASGNAFCQPSQQQQQINLNTQKVEALANLEAQLQSYHSQYAQLSNELAQLNNQINQQCSSVLSAPITFQQGPGQVQTSQNLALCSSLAQEASGISQQLVPIQNEENYIEQEIQNIENGP